MQFSRLLSKDEQLTLRFWWKFQVDPLEKEAFLILGSAWHSFFQK